MHKGINIIEHLPALGVGLGYRDPLRSDILLNREQIDNLEIISEHFLELTREKARLLDLLKQHFTLIPHGISLSIGSAEGLNETYLKQLAKLIERIDPPWWSEHICFTQAGGIDIGHLTPLPFSQEAIDVVCRNVELTRKFIKKPLLLENITYMFTLSGGEMSEPEFISEILKRTDCGLLLDITNLYINSVNHKYKIDDYLNIIPLDRVVQLHYVGIEDHDGKLFDTHAQPVSFPVWQVLEKIVNCAPVKNIILERDSNFPLFSELISELGQARNIWQRAQ